MRINIPLDIKEKTPEEIISRYPDSILNVKDPDDSLIELAISKKPSLWDYFYSKNPKKMSYEWTKAAAFKGNIKAVIFLDKKDLNDLPEWVKEELIKHGVSRIKDLDNPSEELQLLAVNINPESIQCIQNPTSKVLKEAVKKQGQVIRYIENPSIELQLLAIKQNPSSIARIENPDISVQRIVVNTENSVAIESFFRNRVNRNKEIDQEIAKIGVNNHPYVIKWIKNPSKEIQKIAVSKNGKLLVYLENPDKEIQKTAIEKTPIVIQDIKNPDEELQLLAVRQDYSLIQYIKNPTLKVVDEVLNDNPHLIMHIKDKAVLTENLLWKTVKKEPESVTYFPVIPSPEMILYAVRHTDNPEKISSYVKNLVGFLKSGLEVPDPYNWKEKIKEADFFDKVERATEKRAKSVHSFRPQIIKRKYIPKDLNADQLALLRWFDVNGKEEITVKELKQLPFGNTPYFQDLIKQKKGRNITRQDVMQPSQMVHSDFMEDVYSNHKLGYKVWKGVQTIFERKNHVMVMYFPKNNAPKNIPIEEIDPDPHGSHPKIAGNYTIGWIRYTIFDKDIWIDEIQSDLFKSFHPERMVEIKGLPDYLLVVFIREMRRRGYQKFYLPSYEMKKVFYEANPPVSIYKDLPRKFRFKSVKIDKNILRDLTERKKSLENKEFNGWILARNI